MNPLTDKLAEAYAALVAMQCESAPPVTFLESILPHGVPVVDGRKLAAQLKEPPTMTDNKLSDRSIAQAFLWACEEFRRLASEKEPCIALHGALVLIEAKAKEIDAPARSGEPSAGHWPARLTEVAVWLSEVSDEELRDVFHACPDLAKRLRNAIRSYRAAEHWRKATRIVLNSHSSGALMPEIEQRANERNAMDAVEDERDAYHKRAERAEAERDDYARRWRESESNLAFCDGDLQTVQAERDALLKPCACSLRGKLVGDGCAVCNPALALYHAGETIKDLEAERAALKQDAERYRWLRERTWDADALCVVCRPKENVRLGSYCPSTSGLDAMVDAARTKEDQP